MNQFIEYADNGETVIYWNPKYQKIESVQRWLWDIFGQITALKN